MYIKRIYIWSVNVQINKKSLKSFIFDMISHNFERSSSFFGCKYRDGAVIGDLYAPLPFVNLDSFQHVLAFIFGIEDHIFEKALG